MSLPTANIWSGWFAPRLDICPGCAQGPVQIQGHFAELQVGLALEHSSRNCMIVVLAHQLCADVQKVEAFDARRRERLCRQDSDERIGAQVHS